MMTNRDIYLAMATLVKRSRESSQTLEEYLRAVLALVWRYEGRPYITPTEFIQLLSEALTANPLTFDPDWGAYYDSKPGSRSSFTDWLATVREQVVDLREMADAGILANELRYFGVSSPRGARWYNFDVGTYLECAAAGTFGGWEPGDSTGRELVPGDVVVVEPDGTVTAKDPLELERPIFTIDRVTWLDFIRFMEWGQCYE